MLLNPYRFGSPAAALLTNLVSYWQLDEASGIAIDSVGTNHLGDTNTVGTAAGKVSTARSFVRASNEYFAQVSPTLATGDIDFTFSAWVRPATTGAGTILSKYVSAGPSNEFILDLSGSSTLEWMVLGPGGSRLIDNGVGITIGAWHHLVVWHDAVNNQIGMVWNGGSPVTGALSGGANSSPSMAFRIGSAELGPASWNGDIDEVGFWKRMLTPAERAALYNAGNGLGYPFDGSYVPPPALSALLTNLNSYWKLNEVSGVRLDSHGGNHLTDNNTVTSAAGKVGNAADFEFSNTEYLSISSNSTLQIGDIDFTLACWVNLESKAASVGNAIITKDNTVGSREIVLYYDLASNRFGLITGAGGTMNAGAFANNLGSPSLATWYFIVAWQDAGGNTLNIQVNNGTANSVALTITPTVGSAAFIIGGFDSATRYSFDGLIDEVGFWKRMLSPAERTELYNSGNGKTYPFT